MKRAIRYDRGSLGKRRRSQDGALVTEGRIARAGVLRYRLADGTIRKELVTEETLRQSAESFADLSLTLGHPNEKVSPENVGALGVGNLGGYVWVDDDGHQRTDITIRRADAIKAVDEGVTELSCGYDVLLDDTPGEHPDHGPYDAIQTARVGNHVALVDTARGGSTLRLDEGDAELVADEPDDSTDAATGDNPREDSMYTLLLPLLAALGKTARSDSEEATIADIGSGINDLVAERDRLKAAADARKDAADAVEATLTAEKARADAAEAKVTELEAAEQSRADAAELERLRAAAKAHRIDGAAALDLAGARKALAGKAAGDVSLNGRSDAYIDALVDIAVSRTPRADADTKLPKGDPEVRVDGDDKGAKPVNLGAVGLRNGGDK